VSRLRLAPLPGTRCLGALPWLTGLLPSARDDHQRRRRPCTWVDRAQQAVWRVRHWRPESALVVGART
jgi:hypothetical protein